MEGGDFLANLFNPERRNRLESPERAQWQQPDKVVETLNLAPGQTVADIGAGTGYFAFRLAKAVGPSGKVYAVDLQQEMLDTLQERIQEKGISNVVPTRSEPLETPLPDAEMDLVFIANVTHEYDEIDAGIQSCVRILKPKGRLAVVDWKYAETNSGPPLDHRLPPERLEEAARKAGLSAIEKHGFLPYHYFIVFGKP